MSASKFVLRKSNSHRKVNQFSGRLYRHKSPAISYRKTQAQPYCKEHNFRYTLANSQTMFKFSSGCHDSLSQLLMPIPMPNGLFIERKFDVVKSNITVFIGYDMLNEEVTHGSNVVNEFSCLKFNWSMPIQRKFGHLYVCLK